jgi:protein-tyrosine phosphatase
VTEAAPVDRPTSVLVVCTGNVCRSPAAALLLAARLPSAGIDVVSAGTRALVGNPVDGPMAELLRARDVLPDLFAARALTAEQLRTAGLVLVMSQEHRSAAVAMRPAGVRRVLRLREAALVAEAAAADGWPDDVAATPAARLAALPAVAPRYRGLAGPDDLDVPDPYRRPASAYEESFALIEDAVDRLVRSVGGVRTGTGTSAPTVGSGRRTA